MKKYIGGAGLCLFSGGVGYLLEGDLKAALAYAGVLFVGLLLIDLIKQLLPKTQNSDLATNLTEKHVCSENVVNGHRYCGDYYCVCVKCGHAGMDSSDLKKNTFYVHLTCPNCKHSEQIYFCSMSGDSYKRLEPGVEI